MSALGEHIVRMQIAPLNENAPVEGRSLGGADDPAVRSLDCPLVVDLDGGLVLTSALQETIVETLRSRPVSVLHLPLAALRGRRALWEQLAGDERPVVESWPVDQDFLDYLLGEAERGRRIVLATSAHSTLSDALVARFPFISEVVAVEDNGLDGGARKAEYLSRLFPDGFAYASATAEDVAVFRKAVAGILVRAPQSAVRAVGELERPLTVFPGRPLGFSVLRRILRLHQWAKNTLIFVPLLLGGQGSDPSAWLVAVLGFLALGLIASATYVLNDLWDLPSDRRHWSKRRRPLASGDLSITTGLGMAAACFLAGSAITIFLGAAAAAMIALYVALTLAYSLYFKRVPVLDILFLATLFTFRIGLGIVLSGATVSVWLLVFSMFVFGSLSTAKRHSEILRLAQNGMKSASGRGYVIADAPLTLALGVASMLGAILTIVLYLIDGAYAHGFYASPVFLWFMPPILFLFLGRIWLLCQRGQLNDDPVEFAIRDRLSLGLGAAMSASFLIAWSGVVFFR